MKRNFEILKEKEKNHVLSIICSKFPYALYLYENLTYLKKIFSMERNNRPSKPRSTADVNVPFLF